jgi:hypothetical protein
MYIMLNIVLPAAAATARQQIRVGNQSRLPQITIGFLGLQL